MSRRPTSLPLNLFDPNPTQARRIRLGDGRDAKTYVLYEGDSYVDSGFPGCDYRIKCQFCEPAVNVSVTGRVARWFDGEWHVRAKIEFVGDCEPSTFVNGWLVL